MHSNALHYAATGGYSEIASLLLDHGADINERSRASGTALECAIRSHAFSMIDMLLKQGANVNGPPEPLTNTPLQLAARMDDLELVQRLLQLGADANAPAPKWLIHWPHSSSRSRCPYQHDVNNALQWAAENGNNQICQALLDAGADVNASPGVVSCDLYGPSEKMGLTAVAAAVKSGDCELVELFLRLGADVNDEEGSQTALELALIADPHCPELLQLILSAHPKLDSCSLVSALKIGNPQLIMKLLGTGADVNAWQEDDDHGYWCPLSKAVALNDIISVERLLQWGAHPNPEPFLNVILPLVEAVRNANLDLVDTLIAAGADPNTSERRYQSHPSHNCLQVATSNRDVEMIRRLMEAGADINGGRHNGGTALRIAVETGNSELIHFLIQQGADDCLQIAAEQGDIEWVRHLIETGAGINVSTGGQMALAVAVKSGNVELVHFLIEQGADLNSPVRDLDGMTTLQRAVYNQDTEVTKLLLAAGAHADDEASYFYGTSVQIAAKNGDDHLIMLLSDHGANINRSGYHKEGRTALQAAAEGGHYRTVKLLLDRGADPNSPASKEEGGTALQAAAAGGYLHIAELLIEHKADVNAPAAERGGYFALEFAAKSGRLDMLKLLLNAGADITSDSGRPVFESAKLLAAGHGHHAAAKFLKYHPLT